MKGLCELSNETWDKAQCFQDCFPYVEIGAINCENGEIGGIEELVTAEAPSRAQMVVRAGDLLVSATRPTRNAIAIVPLDVEKAIASTGFLVVRGVQSTLVTPKYLFHALRMEFCTKQFDQYSSGGNYPAITKEDFRKIIIPLPSLSEQRKIVAELDAAYAAKRVADEKATNLLASIDEMVLKELGIANLPKPDTSLSSRIFTVSAKEVHNGRLDPIAYQSMRRQFYKNVREGTYETVRLGKVVDVDRCQTDSLDGLTYVGLENINGSDGTYSPTGEKESISTAVLFRKGEILFPKLRPYLNKVWLADFDGAASTEFFPLIPTGVSAEYLIVYLRLTQVARVMTLLMTGNTLPRVQLEDVLSLPVPIPPRSVQDRIASTASSIRAEARKLKADATAALDAAKRKIESRIVEN
jgi:restriction endonuclease S subunit